MSADTIIQDPYDTQAYNRYSYVKNNPLKYTDPSGHSWWTKIRHKVIGVVAIVVGIALIYTGNPYAMFAKLHLHGKKDNHDYNGAVRGSSSKFGYGIQYTDLLFEEKIGRGFMSEQYVLTFIHEVLHHREWFGRTRYNKATRNWDHPLKRNEFTGQMEPFHSRVYEELLNFYSDYPQYVPKSWEGNF